MQHSRGWRRRIPRARSQTARHVGALDEPFYRRRRRRQGCRSSSDRASRHSLIWSSIRCIRSPLASISATWDNKGRRVPVLETQLGRSGSPLVAEGGGLRTVPSGIAGEQAERLKSGALPSAARSFERRVSGYHQSSLSDVDWEGFRPFRYGGRASLGCLRQLPRHHGDDRSKQCLGPFLGYEQPRLVSDDLGVAAMLLVP